MAPEHEPDLSMENAILVGQPLVDDTSQQPRDNSIEQQLATLSKQIRKYHQRSLDSGWKHFVDRLRVGSALAAGKHLCAHGQYLRWVREELVGEAGFSLRTAQRRLKEFEAFCRYLLEQRVVAAEHEIQQLLESPKSLQQASVAFESRQALGESLSKTQRNDTHKNCWSTPDSLLTRSKIVIGQPECDPCASENPLAPQIAELNYLPEDDGLSSETGWPGTAWVAPGDEGRFTPWCLKAIGELEKGNLQAAIVCLPLEEASLPNEVLQFPMAITRVPLIVQYFDQPERADVQLRKRSVLIYIARQPDMELFTRAFGDIAVILTPVAAATHEIQSATDLPRLAAMEWPMEQPSG